MADEIPLIVERDGKVLTLSLNNVDKKNALTSEMCKEIIHFFDVAPPEIKFEGQTSLGVDKN